MDVVHSWHKHTSHIEAFLGSVKSPRSNNVQSCDTEQLPGVVSTGLLEYLSGDRDSRVHWVTDHGDESLHQCQPDLMVSDRIDVHRTLFQAKEHALSSHSRRCEESSTLDPE